jgi:type I restriction enzyme S subunit
MSSKLVKLGDYIRQVDNRNRDNSIKEVRSVSVTKEFKLTGKKVDKSELHNYKIVLPKQFSYVQTTGNEKVFCVALSDFKYPICVTQVNGVFEISDNDKLLPEFLFMYLTRKEFDRFARFNSWGSAREVISWETICDIEIPLPDIETQRKSVSIYRSMLMLSKSHEETFADLQLITNTFTEKLVEKYGTEELCEYITQTDSRNRDLAVRKVQGISIQKRFINSKANMDGVPLSNYKIVHSGEFAYVTVTSRNGQKISIALNDSNEPFIISSTYISFTVKDVKKMLPEFLLLWFKRPEFDRYARYNSWGSARETFDWNEIQRVQLPIPPISVQKSIVAIYHALESRKQLTERLKTTVKEISPVLIKDARNKVLEAVA